MTRSELLISAAKEMHSAGYHDTERNKPIAAAQTGQRAHESTSQPADRAPASAASDYDEDTIKARDHIAATQDLSLEDAVSAWNKAEGKLMLHDTPLTASAASHKYCSHQELLASGFCPECEKHIPFLPPASAAPDLPLTAEQVEYHWKLCLIGKSFLERERKICDQALAAITWKQKCDEERESRIQAEVARDAWMQSAKSVDRELAEWKKPCEDADIQKAYDNYSIFATCNALEGIARKLAAQLAAAQKVLAEFRDALDHLEEGQTIIPKYWIAAIDSAIDAAKENS